MERGFVFYIILYYLIGTSCQICFHVFDIKILPLFTLLFFFIAAFLFCVNKTALKRLCSVKFKAVFKIEDENHVWSKHSFAKTCKAIDSNKVEREFYRQVEIYNIDNYESIRSIKSYKYTYLNMFGKKLLIMKERV